MASVVLVGNGTATCMRRVATVCNELGVSYTIKDVEFGPALKTEEHLAIHPFGQMPVLQDEDFTLFESRAIARYLVQKYGKDSNLIPPTSDLKATAKFEAACSIEMANFEKIASEIIAERVFKKWFGAEPDEDRVAILLPQLATKLDGYERILSKQKYLAGETFTLADLFHLPVGYVLDTAAGSDELQKRPNVARWWKDISSRPSFQSVKDSA